MELNIIMNVDGILQVTVKDGKYFKAIPVSEAKKLAKEFSRLAKLAARNGKTM